MPATQVLTYAYKTTKALDAPRKISPAAGESAELRDDSGSVGINQKALAETSASLDQGWLTPLLLSRD